MMESLTYGAAIIGLMVVGGMTATMIDINIPLQIGSGEKCCYSTKYLLMISSRKFYH